MDVNEGHRSVGLMPAHPSFDCFKKKCHKALLVNLIAMCLGANIFTK